MTSGVLHGSVQETLLCNTFYDSMLKLRMSKGTTLTAYADDLCKDKTGNVLEDY